MGMNLLFSSSTHTYLNFTTHHKTEGRRVDYIMTQNGVQKKGKFKEYFEKNK